MKGNFKAVVVCLLAIVWLGFLSEKADALSVQARYGVGAIPFEQTNSFSFNSMGLNIFVYEGGNLDIFLGAEQDSLSSEIESRSTKPKFSVKATAFNLGFRFKPTTSWRIKPYFPVELLYFQNINFDEVKVKGTGFTLLSSSQSDNKIGGRLGVGTDIGISDRLTLGIELSAISTGPALVKLKSRDQYGNISEDNIGLDNVGINLGLRYSF